MTMPNLDVDSICYVVTVVITIAISYYLSLPSKPDTPVNVLEDDEDDPSEAAAMRGSFILPLDQGFLESARRSFDNFQFRWLGNALGNAPLMVVEEEDDAGAGDAGGATAEGDENDEIREESETSAFDVRPEDERRMHSRRSIAFEAHRCEVRDGVLMG
eukprot:CAMPEP_0172451940 /NCGR_PEP_ID=MMETSP1065-20121228/9751_1 /TAXON_ID=265537 /ORGANISM="Amphiprora paludosa, Strain CCMP125" /LENGTH=158 /DNA_ID=CAMNT_0013203911 /DNA_START=161 /DNA_END=638 /DNA_ORIENTATION=+